MCTGGGSPVNALNSATIFSMGAGKGRTRRAQSSQLSPEAWADVHEMDRMAAARKTPQGNPWVTERKDGDIVQEWIDDDSNWHREGDEPAYIRSNAAGQVLEEVWLRHGQNHRERGPAKLTYYSTGQVQEENYALDDQLHRTLDAAVITYDDEGNVSGREYYLRGEEMDEQEFRTQAPLLQVDDGIQTVSF
jgi:type V secretory pathway adhesin AidA